MAPCGLSHNPPHEGGMPVSFPRGSRVRLNTDLSTTLTRGTSGVVQRVMEDGRHRVRFDEKPDGSPLTPVVNKTVMEEYLEPA